MKPGYRITIAIVLLTVVVAVLFSTPSSIVAPKISLVDTEYQGSSGQESNVRTRFDFITPEKLQEFPEHIGYWKKPQTIDWSSVQKALGAETILARAYRHPKSSDTFFFVIIQSKDPSSFHPPPVCYRALGYEIEEEGTVEFTPADTRWAEGSKAPESQGDSDVISIGMVQTVRENEGALEEETISAKKLVVTKDLDDKDKAQRRVVFYYYVRDEKSGVTDTITMVRISAPTSLTGSYEHTLDLAKELAGDTFPVMFELRPKEKVLGEWLIAEKGLWGALVVIFSVAIPMAFIFYPQIIGRRRKRNSGDQPS